MNFRIGIVTVLLCVAAFSVLKESSEEERSGQTIRARLGDVRALPVGAPVTMAGLRVGIISERRIGAGYAEIDIAFSRPVDLRKNATLYKRRISMLSGPSLEIDPGDSEEHLSSNYIERVVESNQIGDVLYEISEALPQMQTLSEEGMLRAERMRARVNGPFKSRVFEMSDTVEHIHRRMNSRLSKMRDGLIAGESLRFDAKATVEPVLSSLEHVTQSARKGLEIARAWTKSSAETVRASVEATAVDWSRYANPVKRIDRGEGLLGELLNRGEVHDDLVSLTAESRSFVRSVVAWQTQVGLYTQYAVRAGATTSYMTLRMGRGDRFYYLEFVRSSRGGLPRASITYDSERSRWNRNMSIPDKLRVTFQWATRLGPTVLRYGFKESSLGVGADLQLIDKRLKISADVFELETADLPRIKLTASYRLFGYLHMLAGVDDALNPGHTIQTLGPSNPSHLSEVYLGRDFYLGAGLNFSDRDLATLLRIGGGALASLVL